MSPPDPVGAEPPTPGGPPQAAAPSRTARRVGVGVSAAGGLGALVGFFLPWLVFVAAVQVGCRGQDVQVEIYNLYGAATAIGVAGQTQATLAIAVLLCSVAIIALAATVGRRLALFRIRLLLVASLTGLAALGLLAALAIGGQARLIGKTFLYSSFMRFGLGFGVTAGSLAMALVGGAVLHAAARARRQQAPVGEIALALLGIVALLASTTAIVARPAPYPSLTCAQQGGAPFSGGAIYLTTADRIYALDETSGSVQWRCNNPLGGVVMYGAPVLAGGVLYVASFDGYVYAVRADSAAILWRADVGGRGIDTLQAPRVAPFVADGLVFGVNGVGQMYALRTSDGGRAWPNDVARPAVWNGSTPLLADGALIYPAVDAGKLRITAREERTGQRRWRSSDNWVILSGGSISLLSDQRAVYGEETSAQTSAVYLVARSVADGVARWRYTVSAPGSPIVTSAFTVADGVVYLEQRQGGTPSVVALRAEDGVVMWRTLAPDVVSSPGAPAAPLTQLSRQAPELAPTPTPPATPPAQQLTPTPQATQMTPAPQVTPTTTPPISQGGQQAQVTLAADSGGVYVAVSAVPGGGQTTIYRFDARHGAVVWGRTFAHRTTAAPYTMAGMPSLKLTGDSVYLLDPSGTVAAFDARTGASRWQLSSGTLPSSWSPTPGAIAGGAAPVNGSATGLLYVATSSLYAINPLDGAVRWQFTPDNPTTPYAVRLHPPTPVISPPTLAR